MWEQDWALLGIEPTTELGTIKKAYALKLRVTRPDDDAEAYQALRGAYERAQQWVKWQARAAECLPEAVTETKPAPDPIADAAAAEALAVAVQPHDGNAAPEEVPAAMLEAAEAMPSEPSVVPPQALIDTLELAWRRHDLHGLYEAWPAVLGTLQLQPLTARSLHAATFARWVVNLPQLPDDFVAQLDAEFGWRSDYRVSQALGAELAQALQETLDARQPRELNDPVLRARAQPLVALRERQRAGQQLSTLLLLVLMHPSLLRELANLGPATLRRLGLELDDQSRLRALAGRAGLLRLGLAVTVFIGAGLAVGGDGLHVIPRALTWAVSGGFALGAAYLLGALLFTPPGRVGRWLKAWAMHRYQPALGLGLLGAAAFLAYFDVAGNALLNAGGLGGSGAAAGDFFVPVATGLLGMAGLTGAWPRDLEHGVTCVGLIALGWAIIFSGLSANGPAGAALWGCSLWVLFGAAVAERRLRVPGPLTWLLRPVVNSLAMCLTWGPVFSLLPAIAVLGYAVLPNTQVSPTRLFAVWVVSLLALALAQSRADAWVLKRLSASTPSAPDSAST